MVLNYMVYQYDGSRNAVIMTDMDGKELVIDCNRAEPASYVSIAMRPGGLQDYVDVWNELN